MNNQKNTCKHCGAAVSEPKPIGTGPRKGQTQEVCTKCGHANYLAVSPQMMNEMDAGPGIRKLLMPQSVHA